MLQILSLPCSSGRYLLSTPQLRQLRYFVAVAEELHFGRAAERLYIAQPALSQTIARLEDELGVRLLRRDSRHVELTDAGTVFLAHARTTLDAADRAVDAARNAAGVLGGTVELAYSPVARYSIVAEAVRAFAARHPAASIRSREMTTAPLLESLARREIAVAFAAYPHPRAGLRSEVVLREPMVVASSAGSRFAGRDSVRLAELQGETLYLWPRELSPGLHDHVLAVCRGAGYDPDVEEPWPETLENTRSLLEGKGVSLFGVSWALRGLAGVAVAPVEDEGAVVEISLVWREDAPAAAMRFVDVVRELAAVDALAL